MNGLLLELIKKSDPIPLTPLEKEFINDMGEFYHLFDANTDIDIEITLMNFLKEAPKVNNREIEYVLFKMSQTIYKQLEKKSQKKCNLEKEIYEVYLKY